MEPAACVLRGQRRAGFSPGKSVLVIGAGIAGLLHVHVARALGAGTVIATDILPYRLEAAGRPGADFALQADEDIPARVREFNDGRLADMVIVCTGASPAVMQALSSVQRGGTILFFAPTDPGVRFPLSINDLFWRNDITLTTSYAGSPADYALALELIRTGNLKVESMITHKLALAEAQLGFRMIVQRQGRVVG